MTHENRSLQVWFSGNPQGAFTGLLGALFAVLMSVRGTWPVPVWLAPFLGGPFGFFVGRAVTRGVFQGSEAMAKQFVLPDAEGTYAPQYSNIQALEAQDKFAEAAEAWMQVAAERPTNPSPLLRAADLQARQLKNPAAALELYERVRRMPDIREEHVRYASQKIIDIYLARGGDEGRALVELRRFVTMFPDGREADGARAAIARLKERIGRTER